MLIGYARIENGIVVELASQPGKHDHWEIYAGPVDIGWKFKDGTFSPPPQEPAS